jgi:hypothetical protein
MKGAWGQACGRLTECVAAHDVHTQPILHAALDDRRAVGRFQYLRAVKIALRRPRATPAASREAPRALLFRQCQLLQVDARHGADDEARAPVVHVEDLPGGEGRRDIEGERQTEREKERETKRQ